MDKETVLFLFSQTYNSDGIIRKEAESKIEDLTKQPGFFSFLLQIISQRENDETVRTACAIYFKNNIEKKWEEDNLISSEDKNIIRENIFSVFCSVESFFYKYINAVVSVLIREDFPEKWDSLFNQVRKTICSGRIEILHPAVFVLIEIIRKKKNRSKLSEESEKEIEESFLNSLNIIASSLLQNFTEKNTFLIKDILKVYQSTIEFRFPEALQKNTSILQWIGLLFNIVDFYIGKNPNEEKMCKWALKILNTISRRYGIPSKSFSTEKVVSFSKFYMESISVPLFEKIIEIAKKHASKQITLTPRIYSLVCDQLSYNVKSKETWPLVEDRLDFIVSGFLFPDLCFNQDDEEVWEEDPLEYVRTRFLDAIYETYTTESSACDLLETIVRHQKKEALLPILNFVNNIFTQNNLLQDKESAFKKDGSFNIIGTVSNILIKEGYQKEIKMVLLSIGTKELNNSFSFLKCRICWVIEKVSSDLQFTDEEVMLLFKTVFSVLLSKEHLATKVEAAVAIVSLASHLSLKDEITKHLSEIIPILIELTNKTVSETFPYQIEHLLSLFQEEMLPYVSQITSQLCLSICNAISEYSCPYNEGSEQTYYFEDTDRLMAVEAIFQTLRTIMEAVRKIPNIIDIIEKDLCLVFAIVFEKKITDLYTELFDTIGELAYSKKQISNALWEFIPVLHNIFKNNIPEYSIDLSTCFDNFISYGSQTIIQSQQLKEVFFEIIKNYITAEEHGEEEIMHGCVMMESFMMRCPSQINDFVEMFIEMTCPLVQEKHIENYLLVIRLEVLINAIVYNPVLTLSKLFELKILDCFFLKWNNLLASFTRVHDKKLSILAICTLLSTGNLTLIENHFDIFSNILYTMHKTLPEAIEKRRRLLNGEESEEDYSDETEGSDVCLESEEECPSDENEWYENELEEEEYLETPLDSLDVIEFTQKTFSILKTKSPELYERFNTFFPNTS